jgi:hypothetical protein
VSVEPAHGADGDGRHDLFQIETLRGSGFQRVDVLPRSIGEEQRVRDDDVPMNVQARAKALAEGDSRALGLLEAERTGPLLLPALDLYAPALPCPGSLGLGVRRYWLDPTFRAEQIDRRCLEGAGRFQLGLRVVFGERDGCVVVGELAAALETGEQPIEGGRQQARTDELGVQLVHGACMCLRFDAPR